MRPIIFLLSTLFVVSFLHAEAPDGLLTDLLEHTDRVWLDGYPSTVSLAELDSTVERYQTATIFSRKPSFSWIVNDSRNDIMQTAYRVLVGTDPGKLAKDEADLWDSGKVESDASVAVPYTGKDLSPKTVVYWKVKTWNNGNEQPFSSVKSFLTADKLVDYQTPRYPLQKTDQDPVLVAKKGDYYLLDFGKAAFGRLRLTIDSNVVDHVMAIHFGEALKDGRIDRKPGGTIRYASYQLKLMRGTHTYTIKLRPDKRNTGAAAIKMPDYIGEVFPFRYVELENVPGFAMKFKDDVSKLKFDSKPIDPQFRSFPDETSLLPYRGEFAFGNRAVREMVHYPFDDRWPGFSSNDKNINEIWNLCKYSMKATSFAGVFVDGDRERIPYEADALINQLGYYCSDREYSLARYSHEYLIEHATWPTEWILQSVLMAYHDYMYTGDARSIEKYYDDLKAKTLLALADPETGLISTKTGKQNAELMKAIHYNGKEIRDIVDWPQSGILGLGKSEPGEADGFVFKEYNAVVNAYHYEALRLFAVLASAIGKKDDAEQFVAQSIKVAKSFDKMFFNDSKRCYVDGNGTDHASLHANMFPMAFGLVSKDKTADVMKYIRSRGMACSVYGSQFLMDAVYNAGDAEYGFSLLNSESERSWYNMIRVGSTISLEAWDNKYKPNQDWNHAWGAAPANILPRKVAGIEPLEPGFRTVRIKPQPGGFERPVAMIPTIRGQITVLCEGNKLRVTLPANMRGVIELPSGKTQTIGSGTHPFDMRE